MSSFKRSMRSSSAPRVPRPPVPVPALKVAAPPHPRVLALVRRYLQIKAARPAPLPRRPRLAQPESPEALYREQQGAYLEQKGQARQAAPRGLRRNPALPQARPLPQPNPPQPVPRF